MNLIDYPIIYFLNGFAGRSWSFDKFVPLISQNYLLKARCPFPKFAASGTAAQ